MQHQVLDIIFVIENVVCKLAPQQPYTEFVTSALSVYFVGENTVKPVYNDHPMGYLSAFWSSSRWPGAT